GCTGSHTACARRGRRAHARGHIRSNLRRGRVVPRVASGRDSGRLLLGPGEGVPQATRLLDGRLLAVAVDAVRGHLRGQLGRGDGLDAVLVEEAGEAQALLVGRVPGPADAVLVLRRLDLEHPVGLVGD